jgi:hypothetical protein
MDHAMGVSFYKGWIVVTDVQGRVTFHDSYPKELSKKYLVKTFWMSEGMIFRAYENGNLVKEVKGIEEGGKYLSDNGIQPKDQWGETRIIQIMELEIFIPEGESNGMDTLFNLRFDKYELD